MIMFTKFTWINLIQDVKTYQGVINQRQSKTYRNMVKMFKFHSKMKLDCLIQVIINFPVRFCILIKTMGLSVTVQNKVTQKLEIKTNILLLKWQFNSKLLSHTLIIHSEYFSYHTVMVHLGPDHISIEVNSKASTDFTNAGLGP